MGAVILTYDREQAVRRCVDSLRESGLDEIIVLDNGSRTPLGPMPEGVTVCRSEVNLGVAEGRNQAAALARSELLLFLDDDAEWLEGNATSLKALFAEPELGIVSCEIVQASNGQVQRSAIPHRAKRPLKDGEEISYFCGCAFVVRNSLFRELTGFWKELFYSGEELDLSYRLLSKGYRIRYHSKLRFLHHEAPQGRPSGQYLYYNSRNRPWVALRNLPLPLALSNAIFWWSYLAGRALLTSQLPSCLAGIGDSIRGGARVFKARNPSSWRTLRRISRLGGRIFY